MAGNLNRRVIGKCSQCGGVVSVPTVFMSVNRPVPSCERCGAVLDETADLPIVPTEPLRKPKKLAWEGRQRSINKVFAHHYGNW